GEPSRVPDARSTGSQLFAVVSSRKPDGPLNDGLPGRERPSGAERPPETSIKGALGYRSALASKSELSLERRAQQLRKPARRLERRILRRPQRSAATSPRRHGDVAPPQYRRAVAESSRCCRAVAPLQSLRAVAVSSRRCGDVSAGRRPCAPR